MKTILIPTDFSKNAFHAAEYAGMLANRMNANIVFLNTFSVPMVADYQFTYDIENYLIVGKETAQQNLKVFTNNFIERTHFDPEHIAQVVEYGFVADKIIEVARTVNADFIVMGTKGVSNVLDKWLGTISQKVTKTAQCPVWIIPNKANIHFPHKVLYADDFKEDEVMATHKVLGIMKPLETICKVVHVHDYYEDNSILDVQRKVTNLQYAFDNDTDVTFKSINEIDVVEGLEKYIKSYKPDVLALKIHHKSFWSRIFEANIASHFLQAANLPMLTFQK
jgi:nucleotide-binding universal stress UspA family protein